VQTGQVEDRSTTTTTTSRRVVGGGGRVDAAAAVNVNVVIAVVVVAGTQAVLQSRVIQTYQNPDGVLADGPVVVACSRHPLINASSSSFPSLTLSAT